MMASTVRLRFAPSPTGYLHLGNMRVALMNYLFAHQKGGNLVLRIEDTDQARNIQEIGYTIFDDLQWLGITFDESPFVGGPYGPYLQSERTAIYKKHLLDLIEMKRVYRCFCTAHELEEKRKAQLAAGDPPRYDRTCLHLSDDQIKEKIARGEQFMWRFQVNQEQTVVIKDMARGDVTFDLKNFSDFVLTRLDGTFTFLFANFIDDWLMNISHVIRGDDHLTNSALQVALFDALAVQSPVFWHLPMFCDAMGKKLSKRDFGFSLFDLKSVGYLPEAINNYLALVGRTFEKDELQSLNQLVQYVDFKHIHATGPICYDAEKLTWFNHKWIERLSDEDLIDRIKPFLHSAFPESGGMEDEKIILLLRVIKTDLKVLRDIKTVAQFYFKKPEISYKVLEGQFGKEVAYKIFGVVQSVLGKKAEPDQVIKQLKEEADKQGLVLKDLLRTVRYLLTGQFQGIGIHDLLTVLEFDQIQERIEI